VDDILFGGRSGDQRRPPRTTLFHIALGLVLLVPLCVMSWLVFRLEIELRKHDKVLASRKGRVIDGIPVKTLIIGEFRSEYIPDWCLGARYLRSSRRQG
jgi:hypothetical protein